VVNLQKRLTYTAYIIVKPTVETVPTGPNSSLPAESTLTPYMQTMIAQIRAELNKRPIMTRHLLYNKLGWDKRDRLRQAAIYCGYFFESGPWREAIVKWGVDPRQDPKYRKYQTVSFLSYLNTGTPRHYRASDDHIQKLAQMPLQELETQHIFNGKSVSQTGNLYQFCDITDPLIAKILATEDIRTTCAPTYQGWYHVGTWAKATVILKDKMNTIISKGTLDDAVYARITAWPELWDDKEVAATYKAEIDDRQIHQEKMKEHTIMHTVRWAARNPRYAFEKMGALDSQQGQAGETEEIADDEEVPEDMTEIPDTAAAILNEGDKDDEDQEDYNEGEGNEEEDILDDALIPEEAAEDEDDDDCEVPMMAKRLASEGPAPFGGLYAI
jgi:general transcription factor 3C polypeptide 5 (transcription factor C subunit 1)